MGAHQVWELVCDADGCGRNVIAADPDETVGQVVDGGGWGWDDGRLLCADHYDQHRTGRPLAALDHAEDYF